jgi:hypothetical protein
MDYSNDGDVLSAFGCSPEMEKFLCERLGDPAQPISERFRALFSLRNLKGPAPRNALIVGSSKSFLKSFFLLALQICLLVFLFLCVLLLITRVLEVLY